MLAALLCLAFGIQETANADKPKPLAVVLARNGTVTRKASDGAEAPVRVLDLLYAGDELRVPGDAAFTVCLCADGVQETVKAGSTVTIKAEGCQPPEAVAARKAPPKLVVATARQTRARSENPRRAAVNLRGADKARAGITPVDGANVSSDRPELAWRVQQGAKSYRLKVVQKGSQREVWRGEVHEPRWSFPADTAALERGIGYTWTVTDQDAKPVIEAAFLVADDLNLQRREELLKLGRDGDTADRLAAVLALQRLHFYTEAAEVLEALAREVPDQIEYRELLNELVSPTKQDDTETGTSRNWPVLLLKDIRR